MFPHMPETKPDTAHQYMMDLNSVASNLIRWTYNFEQIQSGALEETSEVKEYQELQLSELATACRSIRDVAKEDSVVLAVVSCATFAYLIGYFLDPPPNEETFSESYARTMSLPPVHVIHEGLVPELCLAGDDPNKLEADQWLKGIERGGIREELSNLATLIRTVIYRDLMDDDATGSAGFTTGFNQAVSFVRQVQDGGGDDILYLLERVMVGYSYYFVRRCDSAQLDKCLDMSRNFFVKLKSEAQGLVLPTD